MHKSWYASTHKVLLVFKLINKYIQELTVLYMLYRQQQSLQGLRGIRIVIGGDIFDIFDIFDAKSLIYLVTLSC